MIRPATPDDIPHMLALGRMMHAEAPRFRDRTWSDTKVAALIAGLIQLGDGLALVAEHDGEIVGGFLGVICEDFFGPDRMAQDYALFVRPGKRGAMAGAQLVGAFIAWARDRRATPIVGVSTGVDVEKTGRLLEACGLHPFGQLYGEAI